MDFLDDEACSAWCDARGYRTTRSGYGRRLPALKDKVPFIPLVYPVEAGRKVALSRQVVTWVLGLGPCLIWMREFGVWPSSEHRPLYDRFRQAVGGSGGLGDASGHLASPADLDDAVSVVAMALLFFWDVYVLPEKRGPVFYASHDEYAGVFFSRTARDLPDVFKPRLPNRKEGH